MSSHIKDWPEKIRQRYESYLKTSFFFKDPDLRESFQKALRKEKSLLSEIFPEPPRDFVQKISAKDLASECFPGKSEDLDPALIDGLLYEHQESAIRKAFSDESNIIVATGTASGKTESFLYPILFELYRQHLSGELNTPGVRAMILYPMNALANDQRERLGAICKSLYDGGAFKPTFGQYTGQTPEDKNDGYRNASERARERAPGEKIFRKEMRDDPPHILITNYSMLEYLLIRPEDSALFDGDRGSFWQFIVLDEAHQYRGAKGMEMGMLIRRLKQRLCDGGRKEPFRCIATSATISSDEENEKPIADFAKQLFGEDFSETGIIFGTTKSEPKNQNPQRYHAFLRALEGAFLIHIDGEDAVILNRKSEESDDGSKSTPLEIALCRECGQHYYVGKEKGGYLKEADRDPSHNDFGVDYYLPYESREDESEAEYLCRCCGRLSNTSSSGCDCNATIKVKKCESHEENLDQLKKCEECGYGSGSDPVQEIIHGSDGPNAVIATALHELLSSDEKRSNKVLAFADGRQKASFFAWYAQDSYEKVRDRNLILRALNLEKISDEGLSIENLRRRLLKIWEQTGLDIRNGNAEENKSEVLKTILREAATHEKRSSLAGVGLIRWFVDLPTSLATPESLLSEPWCLLENEARRLIEYILDDIRQRGSITLPEGAPSASETFDWPQKAYILYSQGKRVTRNSRITQWGSPSSAIVTHYLCSILKNFKLTPDQKRDASVALMREVWHALQEKNGEILSQAPGTRRDSFLLNSGRLRVNISNDDIWECDKCASLTNYNIRGICPRNKCPGNLIPTRQKNLDERSNYHRILYKNPSMPPELCSEEHTAQIDSDLARKRQNQFKNDDIHLLSSSTTFEVGVDLGDLDSVFLRNIPPEPFNYAQRAGRAGRREESEGLVLTYCERKPHDLYHYEDPKNRIINGKIHSPILHMKNEKIIKRHMVAVALSAFFKVNPMRFKNVENFVGDWKNPSAVEKISAFCEENDALKKSLCKIVPDELHGSVGINDDSWVANIISGEDSRLALVQTEVCADYLEAETQRKLSFDRGDDRMVRIFGKRMRTIAAEKTLNFLSRKAVIPKYGFPVDVVELEINGDFTKGQVTLQRDLSQAIAEYAPGSKVVANKLEWESWGLKTVPGKTCPVYHYLCENDGQNFKKWNEELYENLSESDKAKVQDKYLIPKFGFVTKVYNSSPPKPKRSVKRLYTTRPYFCEFKGQQNPTTKTFGDVRVTKAVPGILAILCEGKNKQKFFICRDCGYHNAERERHHQTPFGQTCQGALDHLALGHDLETDVIRIQFPNLNKVWETYSVAYAVLLGAANVLEVPDIDLNVAVAKGDEIGGVSIVLYDNVPGGAGFVAQLEREKIFLNMLRSALERVQGSCGCTSSCYGCLRSYRNQFAHSQLDRTVAETFIKKALDQYQSD